LSEELRQKILLRARNALEKVEDLFFVVAGHKLPELVLEVPDSFPVLVRVVRVANVHKYFFSARLPQNSPANLTYPLFFSLRRSGKHERIQVGKVEALFRDLVNRQHKSVVHPRIFIFAKKTAK
jgi:hypothetical protein